MGHHFVIFAKIGFQYSVNAKISTNFKKIKVKNLKCQSFQNNFIFLISC